MSGEAAWRPSASLEILQRRAAILNRVRQFFLDRGVLEVETPQLSTAGLPSPTIESFLVMPVSAAAAGGTPAAYLHTSPEFPMKRLLAAGSGAIFQLCKVFRARERGRLHNPEFTLLEWYRPGYDGALLMDEVEALVRAVLDAGLPHDPVPRLTYRDAFLEYAGVDGLAGEAAVFREALTAAGIEPPSALPETDPDPWRDLVLTHLVEPRLPPAVFIHDYPASQAALARVRPGSPPVAERFELYLQGIEIANGYTELTDAAEQGERFAREAEQRRRQGLGVVPTDRHLLAALQAGMPPAAGVALGLDRLVMLAVGASSIDAVISFAFERA